jgi:hypothetical protein
MPKHVGVENLERINKNPLLPRVFVGLFANRTTTVPLITTQMARAVHLALPYPNEEKRKEPSSFHARSAY